MTLSFHNWHAGFGEHLFQGSEMENTMPSIDVEKWVDQCRKNRWVLIKQELQQSGVVVAGRFAGLVTADERLSYLRDQLAIVLETHTTAFPRVLSAIERIEIRLASEPVVFGSFRKLANRHVKPSVFNVLIEELSPALNEILSPLSDHKDPLSAGIPESVSLAGYLKDENACRAIAEGLIAWVQEANQWMGCMTSLSEERLLSVMASLHAVAMVLVHTANSWRKYQPQWCRCCFRRAAPGFAYCKVHFPSRKRRDGDKSYRQGLRVRAWLGQKEKSWLRHQAQRRAIRQPVRLIAAMNDVLLNDVGQGVTVPAYVKDFLEDSLTFGHWPQVAPLWDVFITHSCPNLAKYLAAKQMEKLACKSSDWLHFVKRLQNGLKNWDEETTEPFWIMHILLDAEDWFLAEATCPDRRFTETANKIIQMSKVGKLTQKQIAADLNVSKQFVSKIMASEKNKAGCCTAV